MGSNFETIYYNGVELNCWDLEGHVSRIRDLWVHYYKDNRCIIYVIDSNDKECIDENIYEIERLVTIQEAIGIPILFIANQKNQMDALTSKEVIEIYQFNKITNRIWKIIEINQINDTEVTEILDWIITGIDKEKNNEDITIYI